jgi:drug/metabolite transporter (DMT)-like permease
LEHFRVSLEPEAIIASAKDVATAATTRRARLIGIALMCCAAACFSGLDTSAKLLGPHVGVIEVAWARYAAGILLTLLFQNPWSHPTILRTAHLKLQLARSLLLLNSTLCTIIAVRYLRLDQIVTIAFSAPFLVTALSGPVLSEWAGPRRWAAIGVGFIGVLIATRPGFGGIHPAGAFMAFGMVSYVCYILITRIVAKNDSTETSLFYTNLVGALALTPVVPFVWTTPQSPSIALLMLAVGAFGSFGHYLLIRAHRHSPPYALAPFVYTQIVWSITWGYLFFGDAPDLLTLVGAAIVIASGLYLLNRERRRGLR